MSTGNESSAATNVAAPASDPPRPSPLPRRGAVGQPLPEEHRPALQDMVNRFAIGGAARRLGVSREVVERGLDGRGLREGSIFVLVQRLRANGGFPTR